MRAIALHSFGDPDGLKEVDRPDPVAAAGQLLIETEAIGVSGVDAVIRRGTIELGGLREGFIPGGEIAGVVTGVGANVDEEWLGRRVWAFTGLSGGYAERAVVGVEEAIPLPQGLAPAEAVTLGSSAPVAHFGLARAHLAAGERVLVRGAAGSIGIAAVELAVRAGAAAVAVTTSSAERGERLRALGATHLLDRAGAAADAPDAFDVILDLVAGPLTSHFVDRLAPNGRLVLVGAVAGFPPADFARPLLSGFQQSRSIATLSLDSVPREELARVRAELFDSAERKELHAVVHDTLPLAGAAEAHRRMDDGEVFGRIVLEPALG